METTGQPKLISVCFLFCQTVKSMHLAFHPKDYITLPEQLIHFHSHSVALSVHTKQADAQIQTANTFSAAKANGFIYQNQTFLLE